MTNVISAAVARAATVTMSCWSMSWWPGQHHISPPAHTKSWILGKVGSPGGVPVSHQWKQSKYLGPDPEGWFSCSRDFSHMRCPSKSVNSLGLSMCFALLDQGIERGQKKGGGRQSQTKRSADGNEYNKSVTSSAGSPFKC